MAEVSYARRAKALLTQAGLAPKKSWGQNFLMDDRVLTDIVAAAAVPPGGTVVELGAGLGALTLALLEHGNHVVAIERDRDLIPLLQALSQNLGDGAGTLTVTPADAARLDYACMAAQQGAPLHVLGNLPYQLSGRILVSMAEQAEAIADAVVLVQKEVAQRLCAEPGSKTYGLLTVLVQRRFDCEVVRDVPPGAFLPPPKVQSQVVRLTRHGRLPWAGLEEQAAGGAAAARSADSAALEAAYVEVAKAAFHTRRKTLHNALSMGLHAAKADVALLLAAARIDASLRAEVLTPADFALLGAHALKMGLVARASAKG